MKRKSNNICSNLSNNLKKEYNTKSLRIVKGDSVKIMRGEYKGVEGKVEKLNTLKGRLSIEGVQREKIKGGQVKVQIHASNVRITSYTSMTNIERIRSEIRNKLINHQENKQ